MAFLNVCISCRRRQKQRQSQSRCQSVAAGNYQQHNNNNTVDNANDDKHKHKNNNNSNNSFVNKNNGIKCNIKKSQHCHTYKICAYAVLLLILNSAAKFDVQSAAVSLNMDLLTNPNFEPLCSRQQEHFIESDGKESSLILEFKPGTFDEKQKSCTRILSAPPSYGFIVRLILPKLRHHISGVGGTTTVATKANGGGSNGAAVGGVGSSSTQTKNAGVSTLNGMTTLYEKLNTTALKTILGRTCPLSIFSSLDPHTPQWRVDPCQLEDTAPEMEDPVRLFHGRIRIVWEHSQHTLKSKLMVTALGKGEQCTGNDKHQCLRIGDEPLLCISKDLICDGIRHCPISNEYDSDEDYGMCWKRRRFGEPLPATMESDIFEHFALEVFRNLFAYDAPSGPQTTTAAASAASIGGGDGTAANSTTTLRKVQTKDMKKHENDAATMNAIDETDPKVENNTEATGIGSGFSRRNSTRSGLHSDLSKYGPWGYLMLGMLLCGGALLICGLWASASQHAVNNEREAALAAAAANGVNIDQSGGTAGPPNYEELDPPPAYSVLFPNQKAASSNTLNALEQAATTAAAAGSAVAGNMTTTIVPPALSPTTTTLTMTTSTIHAVQLESTAPSSSQQQQQQSQSQQLPTSSH